MPGKGHAPARGHTLESNTAMPTAMRRLNMAMRRHTAMRRHAATHEDGDVFQRLVSYRSLRTLELWAPRMETACDLDIHRKTRWGKHHIVVVSHHDHRSAGAFFNLSLLPSALGAPLSAAAHK